MAKDKLSSIKNEEQYEALRSKGMSKEKAARIANSPNKSQQGSKRKYEDRSKEDLYRQAKKIGIAGRSRMSKKELIEALRNHK
jgi:hypothetical protein